MDNLEYSAVIFISACLGFLIGYVFNHERNTLKRLNDESTEEGMTNEEGQELHNKNVKNYLNNMLNMLLLR